MWGFSDFFVLSVRKYFFVCFSVVCWIEKSNFVTAQNVFDKLLSLQLMEALKEQEEINQRLRQYMDKIILSILDHNPSILEIKK